MGTKLYVGNLSFNTTETDLQDLFAQAGPVQEVTLMQDKFTGKSRGFAFVTMTTEADAQKAVTEFNGQTIEGRPLTVNEARPREPRPPGGGGRGYGGGGGGYGGRREGGGGGGQRRGKASRFTVCPVWPLRYLPVCPTKAFGVDIARTLPLASSLANARRFS